MSKVKRCNHHHRYHQFVSRRIFYVFSSRRGAANQRKEGLKETEGELWGSRRPSEHLRSFLEKPDEYLIMNNTSMFSKLSMMDENTQRHECIS